MPAELSVVTEQLPKSQVGMTIEVPAELVDATYERFSTARFAREDRRLPPW